MSTNALIVVKDRPTVGLYKHWDGYPEATLPWVTDFAQRFKQERGYDPDYCMAQLVRDSALSAEKFGLDPSTGTGWGIVNVKDAYYDYKYTICSKTGTVEVESA